MQRFHTGSRYGRSQGKVEVAARNDRFFFGSRYGKRGVNSQGKKYFQKELSINNSSSNKTISFPAPKNLKTRVVKNSQWNKK